MLDTLIQTRYYLFQRLHFTSVGTNVKHFFGMMTTGMGTMTPHTHVRGYCRLP